MSRGKKPRLQARSTRARASSALDARLELGRFGFHSCTAGQSVARRVHLNLASSEPVVILAGWLNGVARIRCGRRAALSLFLTHSLSPS